MNTDEDQNETAAAPEQLRSEAFVACTVLWLHLGDLRVFTCVDGVRGRALFHCGILNAKNRLVYYCIVAIWGISADKRPGCVASGTYSNISFIPCSSHLNMVIMRTEIDELRSCVQTRNGGERGREEKRKIILKGTEPPHPHFPSPSYSLTLGLSPFSHSILYSFSNPWRNGGNKGFHFHWCVRHMSREVEKTMFF